MTPDQKAIFAGLNRRGLMEACAKARNHTTERRTPWTTFTNAQMRDYLISTTVSPDLWLPTQDSGGASATAKQLGYLKSLIRKHRPTDPRLGESAWTQYAATLSKADASKEIDALLRGDHQDHQKGNHQDGDHGHEQHEATGNNDDHGKGEYKATGESNNDGAHGRSSEGKGKGDGKGEGEGQDEGEGTGTGEGEDRYAMFSELSQLAEATDQAVTTLIHDITGLVTEVAALKENGGGGIIILNNKGDEEEEEGDNGGEGDKQKGKRIDGGHVMLPKVVAALNEGLNVMLVGPAGTGKSTIAEHAAKALEMEFSSLSLGPTTPTSKLFGYQDANGNYHGTQFRQRWEFGGVMLIDEYDNGHPGLSAEMNQAWAGTICAFPDGMVKQHPDFRLVTTANTFGRGADRQYVGRNPLDAATLDRFITLEIQVDEALEEAIALSLAKDPKQAKVWLGNVRKWRKSAAEARLNVVISPRATFDGIKMLNTGFFTMEEAAHAKVSNGLSDKDRDIIGIRF